MQKNAAAARSAVRSVPLLEPALARMAPEQLKRWQSQEEKLQKIANRVARLGNSAMSLLFNQATSSAVVEDREVLREPAAL